MALIAYAMIPNEKRTIRNQVIRKLSYMKKKDLSPIGG